MSTCSTAIPGKPRKTKHHGDIQRPQVAEEYLEHAASIDIFNHFRTGAKGLEDVMKTMSPQARQVFGILGFLNTNAFLAYRYLKIGKKEMKHSIFKGNLAYQLHKYKV